MPMAGNTISTTTSTPTLPTLLSLPLCHYYLLPWPGYHHTLITTMIATTIIATTLLLHHYNHHHPDTTTTRCRSCISYLSSTVWSDFVRSSPGIGHRVFDFSIWPPYDHLYDKTMPFGCYLYPDRTMPFGCYLYPDRWFLNYQWYN